jgi:DNA primase
MERSRDQIIQDIRDKSDITSVVSEYVSLKKTGKTYSGLCPFHQEKTPSFTVNKDKQLFYCFGCGAGGDIFTFVMRIENLSFPQAARWLAERAQIPWHEEETPEGARRRKEREALFKIHQLACDFYHQALLRAPQARAAREYLEQRGLGPEAIQMFHIGYALPIWDGLTSILKKKAIPMALAESAGLVLAGNNGFYDRFRDRVMFPITDAQGRVAAFGGRIIGDGHPKYLNSPDTPLFSKGRYLYGLFQAKEAIRSTEEAVIVEGYTDVIQAHLHGFRNVVASLGTALTLEQIKALHRYTEKVVIAYDADGAGQSATVRGLDLLRQAGLTVKVATMPLGDDPDSLLRRGETEVFAKAIGDGVDLFLFKLEQMLKDKDIETPDGKAKAVANAVPLLREVENRVAREEYIRLLAGRLKVSEETLYAEWRSYQLRLRKSNQTLDNSYNLRNNSILVNDHNNPPVSKKESPRAALERELLRGALQEIINFRRIKEALSLQDWENQGYGRIFEFLTNMDTDGREWPPSADLIDASIRGEYLALLAENEAKQYAVDIQGCCARLRQYQIIDQIQQVQKELAAASELGSDGLAERLSRLNDLNKTLRREFPTFSGLT